MSTMLLRRLGKEIKEVKADKLSGISLEPIGQAKTNGDGALDDMKHFMGVFVGPPDTPYAGGSYQVDIRIPDRYPFEPPVMRFETQIWHPNISSQTGAICLDTLGKAWSPILTLKTCLISVQSLLVSPEPNDPQDAQVATMLMHDPEQFRSVAKQWAVLHAGAPREVETHVSTATSSDEVTEQKRNEIVRKIQAGQPQQIDPEVANCRGFNRQMIQKFVNMGFEVPAIVDAFENFELDDNDGEYYELEPEYVGDVTAYLCGEADT